MYLENGCNDAAALANALVGFIDQTGVSDLDFDVEQAVAMTPAVNERRATALAQVQKDRGAKVAFTLAVEFETVAQQREAGIGQPRATGHRS